VRVAQLDHGIFRSVLVGLRGWVVLDIRVICTHGGPGDRVIHS
jgi:hypothetical protein